MYYADKYPKYDREQCAIGTDWSGQLLCPFYARYPSIHTRDWECVIPYGKNVPTEPEVTRGNDISGGERWTRINVKSATWTSKAPAT